MQVTTDLVMRHLPRVDSPPHHYHATGEAFIPRPLHTVRTAGFDAKLLADESKLPKLSKWERLYLATAIVEGSVQEKPLRGLLSRLAGIPDNGCQLFGYAAKCADASEFKKVMKAAANAAGRV